MQPEPQSQPFPQPHPQQKRPVGKIIAIVVIAVIAQGVNVLLQFSGNLFDRRKTPSSAALPKEERLPPLSALTETQKVALQKAAEKWCAAFNEGNDEAMDGFLGTEALLERALAGFKLSDADREAFVSSARKNLESGRTIFKSFEGGRMRFIRLRDIEGQGGALVRAIGVNGSFNYIYFMPAFRGVKVRFVDFYVLAAGAFSAGNIRELAMTEFRQDDDGGSARESKTLTEIKRLQLAGDYKAVVAACRRLSPEWRKCKTVQIIYHEALMRAGDLAAYQAELERVQKEEPGNPSTAFRLFDLHVLKEDWEEAAMACQEVDEFVGGDAVLKSFAGTFLCRAGRIEEGAKLMEEAVAAEPDEKLVVLSQASCECARSRYAEVVKCLRRLKSEFQTKLDPEKLARNQPMYGRFIESKEYKEWKSQQ